RKQFRRTQQAADLFSSVSHTSHSGGRRCGPQVGRRAIIDHPMPLDPHTRLGPYEILALVGEGGMGEVYRALDTRLGRTVAIKVVHTQFSARFETEARAIS